MNYAVAHVFIKAKERLKCLAASTCLYNNKQIPEMCLSQDVLKNF